MKLERRRACLRQDGRRRFLLWPPPEPFTRGAGSSGTCAVTRTVAVTVNECLGFEEVARLAEVIMYPSPARNERFIDSDRKLSVSITNLTGAVVRRTTIGEGVIVISVGEPPNGIYLFLFRTDETLVAKRIVKHDDRSSISRKGFRNRSPEYLTC